MLRPSGDQAEAVSRWYSRPGKGRRRIGPVEIDDPQLTDRIAALPAVGDALIVGGEGARLAEGLLSRCSCRRRS